MILRVYIFVKQTSTRYKMTIETMATPKKSVPLNQKERKALKEYRKLFNTEVDCAVSLSMDRNVLNRIMLIGSGSPESIEKIRKVLTSLNEDKV